VNFPNWFWWRVSWGFLSLDGRRTNLPWFKNKEEKKGNPRKEAVKPGKLFCNWGGVYPDGFSSVFWRRNDSNCLLNERLKMPGTGESLGTFSYLVWKFTICLYSPIGKLIERWKCLEKPFQTEDKKGKYFLRKDEIFQKKMKCLNSKIEWNRKLYFWSIWKYGGKYE